MEKKRQNDNASTIHKWVHAVPSPYLEIRLILKKRTVSELLGRIKLENIKTSK